jgi:hypothetical protein
MGWCIFLIDFVFMLISFVLPWEDLLRGALLAQSDDSLRDYIKTKK